MRPAPSDFWHLDEMVIVIRGRHHWLWRAVYNSFYVQRHLLNRSTFKRLRTDAFGVWENASVAA